MSNQESTEESTRVPEIVIEEVELVEVVIPERAPQQPTPSPAIPVSDDN